ncbi:MAG: response regulator transcription factor [Chitinophagaceae bacterium]|nr:response regulator transcription factor [Chitinophagaceae bacterium]MCW5915184.1 response regulator transcription factor [Chitinophagaceae bacterium]MCZ2396480.1 response regulator transcription factor [Chitinophagales bacterium]
MIKVFITDDHYMVVEGIRSLLSNERDIELIGSASSVESCRAFLRKLVPDVLLLDINLPDGNGVDLCKELREKYPAMFILGISTFNQASYIREMMENGASGYVLKNATQKELTEAIHLASIGKTYMPFEVARTLKESEKKEEHIILGRREKEILNLIKDGYTNAEMATHLHISSNTVDTYRKSLLSKLRAKNTADLVRLAFLHKLITVE